MSYIYITDFEALNKACDILALQKIIAVDTEFKREKTYFPIPCLIQITDGDYTVCIDTVAIKDLSPLQTLLTNQNIIKIFHSGRQDLEIFYYLFNEVPSPVFDTQIAATILGFPDQVGYAKLVKSYLDIDLDKSLTRTDWEKRPLSENQLLYAANDVIYLRKVYDIQITKLNNLNRLHWPDDDFNKLIESQLYQATEKSIFAKLGNLSKLTEQERCIALKIALWREKTAIKKDRPRKFIFDNNIIFELAKSNAKTAEEISRLDNVPDYICRKYAPELSHIINETLSSIEDCPQLPQNQRLDDSQKSAVKFLQKLIKEISEEFKIDASFICNKKDIENLIRGKNNLPINSGWRNEIAGSKIEQALKEINE